VAVAPGLDPAAFALGGKAPQRALAPASLDELSAILKACDAAGEAAVIFGGGTLQGLGFAPARYDVALSTAHLDAVLEYEFRDLTIAVESGLSVARLNATLAERGQFVPLDAPWPERSSVGGVLASGWCGPRRALYGRGRDFVIGTTVVLPDGTIAKAGGMVVKNVTGYDMSKLWCGSLGTLAALARVNFKTLPLPETSRVALAPLPEGTRQRALDAVIELDLEPAAALALYGFDEAGGRDAFEGRLFVMFEGSQAVVERATRDLRSALGAAGVPETTLLDGAAAANAFARLLDAYTARLGQRSLTYRSSGLPADAVERRDALARAAQKRDLRVETLLDLLGGDAYVRVSTESTAHFALAAPALDASLARGGTNQTIFNAPETLRDSLAMWGTRSSPLEIQRDVKARFDPKGTLAPGRFIGRI
jgi:glycolate oxidase FAD binding subunit